MRPSFADLADVFAWWRDRALLLLIFLLPWQGRFIKEVGLLGGVPWEQGTRSLYATELLLLAALVLQFLHASRKKDHAPAASPVFLRFWMLFLLYALVSVIWAPSQGAAGTAWVHLFEGFALCYLLWVAGVTLRTALAAFLLGSAANAGLGIWQFLTQTTFASTALGVAAHPASEAGAIVVETGLGRFLRAYGLMPHPNVFGGFMAVSLAAATALFVGGAGRRASALLLGGVALFSAGLLASFSRSAWLAYAVFFGVFFLVRRGIFVHDAARRAKKAVLVQAVVLFLALLVALPLLMTRMTGAGRLEARSLNDRAAHASQAWRLIGEHYAAGVGIGNMPLAAWRELRPQLDPHGYQPAHNVLLLAAVELGFFGFMTMLGALWTWVAAAVPSFRRAREPLARAAAALPVLPLVLGAFDHYPLTLYAGTLLAGFCFGVFLKNEKD